MAKMLRYKISGFSVGIFGFSLRLNSWEIRPFHQMLIHLSGPVVNILIASLFFTIYGSCESAYINTLLAFFNLLPVFPLDGGKIVNIFISHMFTNGAAYQYSRFSSLFFPAILFITGICLLQYNILNAFILLISVNLFRVSRSEADYLLYSIVRSRMLKTDKI